MAERIFVQIPAYRDRELWATLHALLHCAAQPQRLRVVVCWQYGPEELARAPDPARWPQVELIRVAAQDSLGVNWARHLIQQRYDGEPYTLWLDSHHRFVPGWDERVLALYRTLQERGVARPVLTAYLPPYDPARDPASRTETVFKIALNERRAGLAFALRGHAVPNWRRLRQPLPAHYASLHFLLAQGRFCTDVPIDPALYFFADEIAIALRAYTHGYDLFHPHQLLGWHLYDRASRVAHWVDHSDWRRQHEASLRRLAALYRGELPGVYGLGKQRSLPDFESYVGAPLIAAPETA